MLLCSACILLCWVVWDTWLRQERGGGALKHSWPFIIIINIIINNNNNQPTINTRLITEWLIQLFIMLKEATPSAADSFWFLGIAIWEA